MTHQVAVPLTAEVWGKTGGQSRIRTCVGSRRQIYSLFPLATRASAQQESAGYPRALRYIKWDRVISCCVQQAERLVVETGEQVRYVRGPEPLDRDLGQHIAVIDRRLQVLLFKKLTLT